MLKKEQELKHSIILLEDATISLFEMMKAKKFKKRKLVKIQSAFLDLIHVLTKAIFKDFNEYSFYCKAVKKEVDDHIESMQKEFMA